MAAKPFKRTLVLAMIAAFFVPVTAAQAVGTTPSPWEECVSTKGNITQGCHRIASFNVGNPDWWPKDESENNRPSYPEYKQLRDQICKDKRPSGTTVSECVKYGAWRARKDDFIRLIREADVDILALQEVENGDVWTSWGGNLGRYSDQIDKVLRDQGFAYAGSSRIANRIYYRTSAYALVEEGVQYERDLLSSSSFWNYRGLTGTGARFPWAKLRKKGVSSSKAFNTILVSSVHIPSRNGSGFPTNPNESQLADIHAYRRAMARFAAVDLGKKACINAGSCSSVIDDPKIPVVVAGDFNDAFGAGNAPDQFLTHARLKFSEPRHASIVNGSWSAARRKIESTSISHPTNRDSGRVIDYVFYKAPSSYYAHGANSRTVRLDDGMKDHLISDHRMVRLALWLKEK